MNEEGSWAAATAAAPPTRIRQPLSSSRFLCIMLFSCVVFLLAAWWASRTRMLCRRKSAAWQPKKSRFRATASRFLLPCPVCLLALVLVLFVISLVLEAIRVRLGARIQWWWWWWSNDLDALEMEFILNNADNWLTPLPGLPWLPRLPETPKFVVICDGPPGVIVGLEDAGFAQTLNESEAHMVVPCNSRPLAKELISRAFPFKMISNIIGAVGLYFIHICV